MDIFYFQKNICYSNIILTNKIIMKNKKCSHIKFWQIYKIINFNKTFWKKKGREFKCEICHEKCKLKWKWYEKINNIVRFFTYLLWLLPAIILILLVACGKLNFLIAILIITVFHFLAMYFIINSRRLQIEKK